VFKNTNNYTGYNLERTGGTVRFGLPITEHLSSQVAYNFVADKYIDDDLPVNAANDPAYIRMGTWTKSSVSGALVWDSIDNRNDPHEGLFARFTGEFAGVGGDARWLKATAKGSYYKTISEDLNLVGILSVGAGHIKPTGNPIDPKTTPDGILVGDLFKANSEIVRGFKSSGFGPTVGVDFIGGTTYLSASAEMQFPMPAIPQSIGIKGAVFADIGTLFGTPYATTVTNTALAWRSSVGASLIWASPFGPLRVDYAVPVMKEAHDQVQNFNFGISTKF
jgi:outer membrane protein insertion porin family